MSFDFDYQISVIFSSSESLTTADGSLDALFSTRTYQQNNPGVEEYTIDLVLDEIKLKTLLNASNWYGSLTAGTTGCSIEGAAASGTSGSKLGNRLLEIMALKLFEHAAARAAILNDSGFLLETLLDNIVAGISASVVTDKDNIFNQYVILGRLSTGDKVTAPVEFDFSNFKMTFQLYLNGNLPNTVTSYLANRTTLGSGIVDGSYHIPISFIIDGSTV